MVNWLIKRAMRTPYYHIADYMERYWLVPYQQVIWRTVSGGPRGFMFMRDGTGPVTGFRPLARLFQFFDVAIRVHHILRSDAGRDPHDHPWPYLTVILKGGYYEHRYDERGIWQSCKWHGAGSVLFRRANSLHKLEVHDQGTWTLFITGKKCQKWGFKPAGRPKIPYDQYEGTV